MSETGSVGATAPHRKRRRWPRSLLPVRPSRRGRVRRQRPAQAKAPPRAVARAPTERLIAGEAARRRADRAGRRSELDAAARPAIKRAAAANAPARLRRCCRATSRKSIGEGGKALAAYFKPLERGDFGRPGEDIARMATTLGRVAEYYLSDAQRALAAQAALSRQFLDLWASTLRRLQGEPPTPVAAPDPGDKRFDHPEWRDNPYFDFLKQAYVLTTRWAKDLVERAPTSSTRRRATRRSSTCGN